MICSKCGKERENNAPDCGCGAVFGASAAKAKLYRILNICLLIAATALTAALPAVFFVSAFGTGNTGAALYIAIAYIICMAAALPSLNALSNKVGISKFKKLNTAVILAGFAAVLTIVVVGILALDFPLRLTI